jgi:uncharacterized protein YbbC (DUF1343 family)
MLTAGLGVAVIVAVLTLIFSASANGQPGFVRQCGDRDKMVGELQTRYGESSILSAINEEYQSILEIFGEPNGNTWTALVTYPHGSTCGVAHGDRWTFTRQIKLQRIK